MIIRVDLAGLYLPHNLPKAEIPLVLLVAAYDIDGRVRTDRLDGFWLVA